MLSLLLSLLACGDPVVDGLPEVWSPPEHGTAWLFETPTSQPIAPLELELLSTPRAGEPLLFPAWLPMAPLPAGTLLSTQLPEAKLLPLVQAPAVSLDELHMEAWSWVGVDPVSGEAAVALPSAQHGQARVWVQAPAGEYVLMDGERAWGLRLQ